MTIRLTPVDRVKQGFFGLLFIAILHSSASSAEVEYHLTPQFDSYVQYRELNQRGFSNQESTTDSFLLQRINGEAYLGNFYLSLTPELRTAISHGVGKSNSDPARVTIRSPRRLMDLSLDIIKANGHAESILDIERAYLSYQIESSEFYIGRKVVSLGVLRVFPVWNKFSPNTLATLGLPEYFSQDSVGFSSQHGQVNVRGVGVATQEESRNALFLETTVYSDWIEAHVLGAHWWDRWVLGLALSKDIAGSILKAEYLNIDPGGESIDRQVQIGLGFEDTFTDKLSVLFENLYLSQGATDPNFYDAIIPSAFRPYRARYYSMASLNWKPLTTLSLSPGAMWNWIDGSVMGIFQAQYNMSNKIDLVLDIRQALGADNTEFSSSLFKFWNENEIGTPTLYRLGMKVSF